jgi:hypothetical protein
MVQLNTTQEKEIRDLNFTLDSMRELKEHPGWLRILDELRGDKELAINSCNIKEERQPLVAVVRAQALEAIITKPDILIKQSERRKQEIFRQLAPLENASRNQEPVL